MQDTLVTFRRILMDSMPSSGAASAAGTEGQGGAKFLGGPSQISPLMSSSGFSVSPLPKAFPDSTNNAVLKPPFLSGYHGYFRPLCPLVSLALVRSITKFTTPPRLLRLLLTFLGVQNRSPFARDRSSSNLNLIISSKDASPRL